METLTEIQLIGQPTEAIYDSIQDLDALHCATLSNCEITTLGNFQNLVTMNLHNVPLTPEFLLKLLGSDQRLTTVHISGLDNAKDFMCSSGIWMLSHPTLLELGINEHKLSYTGAEKRHFAIFSSSPQRSEAACGGHKTIFVNSENAVERKINIQGSNIVMSTRRNPVQWVGQYTCPGFSMKLWADSIQLLQGLNSHTMVIFGVTYVLLLRRCRLCLRQYNDQ